MIAAPGYESLRRDAGGRRLSTLAESLPIRARQDGSADVIGQCWAHALVWDWALPVAGSTTSVRSSSAGTCSRGPGHQIAQFILAAQYVEPSSLEKSIQRTEFGWPTIHAISPRGPSHAERVAALPGPRPLRRARS